MTAPDAGRGIWDGEETRTFTGLPRDTFRILHVSTGNVCRSPITERLTRHALADRLGDPLWGGLIVESAGTWGHEGAPMEANAEAVLADFGADASGFTGRELLDEHPLTHGLAELVAYLQLGAETFDAVVDEDTIERIAWRVEREDGSLSHKEARLPRVIFAR